MTETKHTPGPWVVKGSNVFSQHGWQDTPIAQPCINPGIAASEANARLIAAAPELLAAAEKVVNNCHFLLNPFFGDEEEAQEGIKALHAAIAKARGRE